MFYNLLAVSTEFQRVMQPLLMIIMVLLSIAVTVLVLMQDGNTNNITGLTGSNSESHYGKNKTKSRESVLKTTTLILSALLLIIVIVYFVLKSVL